MRTIVLSAFFVLALLVYGARSAAAGECVDPKRFYRDVLRLEGAAENHSGSRWMGTGWLYRSSRLLVTNRHLVKLIGFEEGFAHTFKVVQKITLDTDVYRFQNLTGTVIAQDEKNDIALVALSTNLELDDVLVLGATTPTVRPFETLSIVGYSSGALQFGRAWVQPASQADEFDAGYRPRYHLPLKVEAKESLEAFTPGSSGSPLFTCEGSVAGIVWGNNRIRASFGRPLSYLSPNVYATSIRAIEELYQQIPKTVR